MRLARISVARLAAALVRVSSMLTRTALCSVSPPLQSTKRRRAEVRIALRKEALAARMQSVAPAAVSRSGLTARSQDACALASQNSGKERRSTTNPLPFPPSFSPPPFTLFLRTVALYLYPPLERIHLSIRHETEEKEAGQPRQPMSAERKASRCVQSDWDECPLPHLPLPVHVPAMEGKRTVAEL